ncbi:hypothetical protein BV25DRAFT_1188194 [Artomyces pyxidatus]|uniref:Uncharacterized protein n=1 Tax=Artomyces pyxidatus TaxID=48021 RepID=A0ACB8SS09_9AGAM|nr:hypothetical protein BV25DRAFT_1188194 [Artomyces pyxidatus]
MAYLNGLVGHNGGYGCRLYCPIKGRHKHGQPYYYPAFLIPDNYTVPGCDHPDYDAAHIPVATQGVNDYATNLQYVLDSTGETNYKRRRLATGISKPSIFSGLPRTLGVPGCFPADLMHLVSLNLTDLFLGLWRGTIDCDATDNRNDWDFAVLRNADTWKQHGAVIANALPYLPTSFDRPPRNPAEKISSGYKAWEFLTYIFGLAPATLYGILPDQYWVNFCRLVGAVRLLHQRSITRDEILRSHARVVQFIKDIHALIHMAFETIRLGPLCYFTQWTLERTIGNLVEELKQHSRPYANLSQRYLRRGEVNALKAMVPELDPDGISLPPGAQSFEDGYVFLPARDKSPRLMGPLESQALWRYLGLERGDNARVARWSRLRLPNGQIARAAWKEKAKSLNKVRMCRNVKLHLNNRTEFAEVQFYFSVIVNSVEHPLALVSLFSPPDPNMLEKSLGAVWSCRYQGAAGLRVVPIKCITSVVAVVPFPLGAHTQVRAIAERPHFIVEKMGLDVAYMGGHEEIEAIADEVE